MIRRLHVLLALPLLAPACARPAADGGEGDASARALDPSASDTGDGEEREKGKKGKTKRSKKGKRGEAGPPDPAFAALDIVDPPPAPAVSIDGQPLDLSALGPRLALREQAMASRRADGELPAKLRRRLAAEVTAELMWSELLRREAERTGVDYDPAELAEQEALERQDVRDWPAWLARQGHTEELRHQLNVDYYREQALMRARGSLEATEEELQGAFEAFGPTTESPLERVRASHMLFAIGPREPGERILPLARHEMEAASEDEVKKWEAAALERAKAMRARSLEPGVDFNELASQVSEGPGRARGGDMGVFPFRQMEKPYAEAAFALEPGTTSEPVRGRLGWYVIHTFAKIPANEAVPFEHLRPDLVRMVEARKVGSVKAALRGDLVNRYRVKSPFLEAERLWVPKPPPPAEPPGQEPSAAPKPVDD